MKKLRIAITLAGQLRSWMVTSKIFEYYNKIDENVQYDFFLTTWDDKYDGIDYDMDSYTFLNDYELFDMGAIEIIDHLTKYSYLLKQVNNLKNEYALKNHIEYDFVITTRPDAFIHLETFLKLNIDALGSDFYNPSPKRVYSETGTMIKKNESKNDDYYTHDIYIAGHSDAIDVYSNMYDDLFIDKIRKSRQGHIANAEQLVYNHIINERLDVIPFTSVIRSTQIDFFKKLLNDGTIARMYNPKLLPTISKQFEADFIKCAELFFIEENMR